VPLHISYGAARRVYTNLLIGIVHVQTVVANAPEKHIRSVVVAAVGKFFRLHSKLHVTMIHQTQGIPRRPLSPTWLKVKPLCDAFFADDENTWRIRRLQRRRQHNRHCAFHRNDDVAGYGVLRRDKQLHDQHAGQLWVLRPLAKADTTLDVDVLEAEVG